MDMTTAWLAGLLEGEATFALHQGKYPLVQLTMTDRDVVERAWSAVPGAQPVRTGKNSNADRAAAQGKVYKPIHTVTWNGQTAADLMWRVLPLMGERRTDKILTIMADWLEYRMRICVECGTEYDRSSGTTTYCGLSCRTKRNNRVKAEKKQMKGA